jgi:hypothetical protein
MYPGGAFSCVRVRARARARACARASLALVTHRPSPLQHYHYRYALVTFWMQSSVPKDAASALATIAANEAPGPWWNMLNGTQVKPPRWHWHVPARVPACITHSRATQYYKNIDGPTVFWAGWYDIFLIGNLAAFEVWRASSRARVVTGVCCPGAVIACTC